MYHDLNWTLQDNQAYTSGRVPLFYVGFPVNARNVRNFKETTNVGNRGFLSTYRRPEY